MKKIGITLIIIAIISLTAIAYNQSSGSAEYLRIHIRANSNSQIDQSVKYEVKDKVVSYLTPFIASCTTKRSALNVLSSEEENVNEIINEVLKSNGLDYGGKMVVRKELFPTRVYEDFTLEEGFYDAVIIELGKAEGDNWWCVVYPPLCFQNSEKLTYRSKIAEIIQNFRAKYIKE